MLFVVESSRWVKKERMEDGRWKGQEAGGEGLRTFVTVKGNRAVQARSQLIAAVWLRVDPPSPFLPSSNLNPVTQQATNFRRSDARGHSA